MVTSPPSFTRQLPAPPRVKMTRGQPKLATFFAASLSESSNPSPSATFTPVRAAVSLSLMHSRSQAPSISPMSPHCPSCHLSPTLGAGAALRMTKGPLPLPHLMAARVVAGGISFCRSSTLLPCMSPSASLMLAAVTRRFEPGTITMWFSPSALTVMAATPEAPGAVPTCLQSTPAASRWVRVNVAMSSLPSIPTMLVFAPISAAMTH
mmetsp:Transcript_7051/g.16134  ORF Transcript_7051/g.16134 Transcript_7051/m.16134 type:complete len:208 (-) Transcript_7051:430-1053(-)